MVNKNYIKSYSCSFDSYNFKERSKRINTYRNSTGGIRPTPIHFINGLYLG